MADGGIRLLIVDDIASTRENLVKLLSFEDDIEVVGTASDGRQGVEEAHRLQPDLVLTDVNMPLMDGIQLTELLTQVHPTCPVIIMSVQGERDYLRRAMQAGAREFLIKPFSHDELVAVIRRVHSLAHSKGGSPDTTTDAPPPAAPAAPTRSAPAEVFMVFSGKGGTGKSVVAVNLAVALAQQTRARVALVDLDLQFGDIGVMLNLDHGRSITDLIDSAEAIGPGVLDEVLATGPAGIRVLLAPTSPELADLVTPDQIGKVLGELRRTYDVVIVDTSSHLGEANLQVVEGATKILVITALTIPAIKDAKLTLKVLESLNVEPGNVLLVVNRVDGYCDFNRDAIEANLRAQVVAHIPHDARLVGEAVNRGTPFVETQPDAEVSGAIRELASRLVPQEQVAAAGATKKQRRKGLFGR
ncbi:MAG: AAA family ATPase [Candidatus Dormibacteria bacterium]